MKSYKFAIGIVYASAFGGCAIDGPQSIVDTAEADSHSIGSTKQAIINGNVMDLNTSIAANMVNVPNCSAVALDSEWVLTAAHCTPGLVRGTSTLSLIRPVETKTLRDFVSHPSQNATSGPTPYADIALLRVHPFTSTALRNFQLWNSDLSQLIGDPLFCAGRGDNTYPGSGFGTWRWAYLNASTIESSGYRMYPSGPNNQIQWSGDSGGPCLFGTIVTGILSTCFDSGSSAASCYQVGLSPTISGWVEDTRQRSRLFFYRKTDGAVFVSALERDGSYTSSASHSLGTNWTHVTLLRNGAILLYNSTNGAAAAYRVEKTHGGVTNTRTMFLPSGMTHIVSVGPDRIFMYNRTAGTARTGRLTTSGDYTEGSQQLSGFSAFSHIVGTKAGGLFMYQYGTGVAGTATVDANLNYYFVGAVNGFSADWDRITAVNERGIFLYNSSNGIGWTAQISATGTYSSQSLVNGIGSGYSVVGATNGTLLFRNGVGGARLAKVDTAGVYTPLSTMSGFSSDWTNVVAE